MKCVICGSEIIGNACHIDLFGRESCDKCEAIRQGNLSKKERRLDEFWETMINEGIEA